MTIKEAFQKLSKVTNAGVKNPWFVIRNLGQTFADVADKISYNEMITSKKLWVNANPTTAFAAGDVTVDNSADYDAFVIYFQSEGGYAYLSCFIPKAFINDNTNHPFKEQTMIHTAGKVYESLRNIKCSQATDSTSMVITFSNCTYAALETYGTSATTSTSNVRMVPQFVIGVKFNS